MAQSKYKIHWIDQNGIERKCPLFDSTDDFSYIYRGKNLHAICSDGVERVAPLAQGAYANGVKIKTSDAVGVYSLNEINKSAILIMSTYDTYTEQHPYSWTIHYVRQYTSIVKTVAIDYDIDIVLYDDDGHSTTIRMNADEYSLSLNLVINNTTNNFYVKVKVPIGYKDIQYKIQFNAIASFGGVALTIDKSPEVWVFENDLDYQVRVKWYWNNSCFYDRTLNNGFYAEESPSTMKIDIPVEANILKLEIYVIINGLSTRICNHDYSFVPFYAGFAGISHNSETTHKIATSGNTEIASQTKITSSSTGVGIPLTLE